MNELSVLARAALALTAAVGGAALAQTDAVIRITAGRAEIRAEPSATAPVYHDVTEGAYLLLVREEAGWFQVQLPPNPRAPGLRALGYVSTRFATRVTGAEAAKGADLARRLPARSVGGSIAVGAELPGKTIWLKAQSTRAIPIAGPGSTVEAIASNDALINALGASAVLAPAASEVTWVWVTGANAAAPALASRQPSFYVSYGEVPGLNSNEWAPYVVRLAPAGSSWRVVSALAGPASAQFRAEADWFVRKGLVQDERRGAIKGLAHGMVRLTLAAALEPGEYAIVIRPAYPQRRYGGREILGDDGPGVAFGAAWVFVVK